MTWDCDGWHAIPGAMVAAWKKAYPRINVDEELEKMNCWLLSNAAKRPKSNWLRFVNSWLARAKPERRAATFALGAAQQPQVLSFE